MAARQGAWTNLRGMVSRAHAGWPRGLRIVIPLVSHRLRIMAMTTDLGNMTIGPKSRFLLPGGQRAGDNGKSLNDQFPMTNDEGRAVERSWAMGVTHKKLPEKCERGLEAHPQP